MNKEGNRTRKSLLNAASAMAFYFLSLLMAFFSRKIFLDNLGADFIGLTGTLTSILGLLNLSELGIGLSVSYFLYKPLADNNREEVAAILSLLGFLYKRIGQFIVVAGVAVSLLFPLIFSGSDMPFSIIYFAYYSFLASSAVGYFINYRQTLLDADQKMYLVAVYFQSFGLLKSLVQIVLALTYKNLYLWVAVEFLFSLLQCWVLNWKINREYPWLTTDKSRGPLLLKQYPQVLKKTRQIVVHQLKDFLLGKSDEIMIFAFVSLRMVAYYGNYTMIISKLSTMFLTFFSGMTAGIGNLVAESSKAHVKEVFWQLSAAKYFTAGVLVLVLSFLINPFICWWLGAEYQLGTVVVVLFMINLYIMQTRSVVDMFNHSYGLYGDVWSAWVEGIVNIIVTVAIALNYGIVGILMGKIVSLFLIVVLWKPYYLFSKGLEEPVGVYWRGVGCYHLSFLAAMMLSVVLTVYAGWQPEATLPSMMLYAARVLLPAIALYFGLLFAIAPGMRQLVGRLKK